MNNSNENIDNLISKIFNEEIEKKSNKIIQQINEEWTEIKMDEHESDGDPQYHRINPKFTKNINMDESSDACDTYKYHLDNFGKEDKRTIEFKSKCEDSDIESDLDEQETEEGNAFSGALAQAKEKGKDSFEVDGKKYHVKEGKEKWIQKTEMKKGALHKKLNVPEDEKIPESKLKALKKELMKKAEGDKKLSASDSKLLKQVNLALTLKGIKESKNSLTLTEDELISMIENIVLEQKAKVKDIAEKDNISKKTPEGLRKTEKAWEATGKENDDYAKELAKKLSSYLKDSSKGKEKFDTNPTDFPKSNFQMDKEAKVMKYKPSQAVEEYIDAFSYPGQTNLRYDEIKPDDKNIEKYLEGDSTTGNSDEYANSVKTGVGKKFMKNYKENLYGAEQASASYKRQPQPVDITGNETTKVSLKSIK